MFDSLPNECLNEVKVIVAAQTVSFEKEKDTLSLRIAWLGLALDSAILQALNKPKTAAKNMDFLDNLFLREITVCFSA